MSELQIITNENELKKRKNTKFWVSAGVFINLLVAVFMWLTITHEILGIVLVSTITWGLVALILALTNSQIRKGED